MVDADCGEPLPGGCSFRCLNERCSPDCTPRCAADGDCAMGQECVDERCRGDAICPNPVDNPEVRYVGQNPVECAMEFECEEGEEQFNNVCGCGCIGEPGGNGGCNCPDEVDPVCGVNDVQYRNACEAECAGVRANPGPCMAPCPPVDCNDLECPNGLARDDDGCQVCECADDGQVDLCEGFRYQPCSNDADCADPGGRCQILNRCVPSNCDCDPATGNTGVCTNDCREAPAGLCVD